MTNRISTLISVFGVLVAAMLLSGAIYEYLGGASVLWVAGGALIFLTSVYTLARDLRTARKSTVR